MLTSFSYAFLSLRYCHEDVKRSMTQAGIAEHLSDAEEMARCAEEEPASDGQLCEYPHAVSVAETDSDAAWWSDVDRSLGR